MLGSCSDRGDYRGQFLIGAAIWSGDAETSNKREGERLISPLIPQIRRGEKEGDHWAATMLAILYANGIGVEADLAQAKHYYERALEIEPTNVWAVLCCDKAWFLLRIQCVDGTSQCINSRTPSLFYFCLWDTSGRGVV